MTPPILAFQDLHIRAGPLTLLEVPSFRLSQGERVSLVGPNGSGKTTFLHAAACLRPVDAGQIAISEEVVNSHNAASLRRRISVVFQDPLLFSVDVLRNAAAGLRFHGVPRVAAELRATEFLDLFGVAHLARRKPYGLSGGEAARVALARALATDPDLLLLDEPFSSLDAGSRAVLLPELRERLVEREAAAILVTHDIAEAFAFASRLVVLDAGRVIADGDARTLALRPPSRRAATLLGVENVISGRVIATERGVGTVQIASGPHVLANCHELRPIGSEVAVTVPAGMIRLLPVGEKPPDGWNALSACVGSVASQPGWDVVTLTVTGVQLQTRQTWDAGGSRWTPGDAIIATFPPEAVWIVPDVAAG